MFIQRVLQVLHLNRVENHKERCIELRQKYEENKYGGSKETKANGTKS